MNTSLIIADIAELLIKYQINVNNIEIKTQNNEIKLDITGIKEVKNGTKN